MRDFRFSIATGYSAKSRAWKNKKTSWGNLVDKLSKPTVTSETIKEYLNASKADQSRIKDVGGYVGGYLTSGRRQNKTVLFRTLLTLDIDEGHSEIWEDFTMLFDTAAVIHATHKHTPEEPRYRLIIPLNRDVTPEEYGAISRKIAEVIGIEFFDRTTFEVARLMFWASTPKDVEYYFEEQEGPLLDADAILARYVDWQDVTSWATADKQFDKLVRTAQEQEDPEQKKGLVGTFCRTFTVNDILDGELSNVYEPTYDDTRYTYKQGTTSGGLVVYDGKFAYSHHGTDPISGQLVNAFDLLRIHKFGHLDKDIEEGGSTSKSYKETLNYIKDLPEVKKTLAQDNINASGYEFAEPMDEEEFDDYEEVDNDEDPEWTTRLEVDQRGGYLSSAVNVNLILKHDSKLKNRFKYNDFDYKPYVVKSLPWRSIKTPEPMRNVDYSGLRNYIESVYGILGSLKIDDALLLELERNRFHPIRDYLSALKWDGEHRIDKLLVDYFGADDNLYTHEACRKMLLGAINRVFTPGCKFDLVLTLTGPQGKYKSTFFDKLGQEWYSDTFITVHGKESFEQLQGAWVIEMAELSGLKQAEVETIKHFISKRKDQFRPSYGRTVEIFLRQGIFVASSNKLAFLRDPTGNRRFMPVSVVPERILKSVKDDLTPEEVNQIWAEAMVAYKEGEQPYLSAEANIIMQSEQYIYSEVDERAGIIERYLNTPLPSNWHNIDLDGRRLYLSSEMEKPEGSKIRDVVCVAEVWCECLGRTKESMSRYETKEINDILRSLTGWEQPHSTKAFPIYGTQKFYRREEL